MQFDLAMMEPVAPLHRIQELRGTLWLSCRATACNEPRWPPGGTAVDDERFGLRSQAITR
jgi:hypothetical protein